MTRKDYVGEGLTIHWDSERCVHSQRCFRGAPTVFDPQARPWVDPDGAPAADVAAVIDTCPSGALSYTRTDGGRHGRRGWIDPAERPAAVEADADWAQD